VLIPSFTFVSTASAFALRGARLVFVDSDRQFPNVSLDEIKAARTSSTKVVVVVHYAGMALDLEAIRSWCDEEGLYLVEDAAQSIHTTYFADSEGVERWLGSYGDLATFSFHETKNISSGQGGGLVVNNPELLDRAYTIWEKGTNRRQFMQGTVDKYGWIDLGSSFLSSEFTNAVLLAQLENAEKTTSYRVALWRRYYQGLQALEVSGLLQRMAVPPNSGNNGHIFYFMLNSNEERTQLIQWLAKAGVQATFHYQPLEQSPYIVKSVRALQPDCEQSSRFSETLLRMPIHLGMSHDDVDYVIENLRSYFKQ
jgi:dTDP-4-amino-4,6-dideoxygalactose transaminase